MPKGIEAEQLKGQLEWFSDIAAHASYRDSDYYCFMIADATPHRAYRY